MRSFNLLLLFVLASPVLAQPADFDHINLRPAENRARQFQGEELDHLPILVQNLTATLNTDVERFRAIYLWVCHNIKGDYAMTQMNIRKRKRLQEDGAGLEVWNSQVRKEIFSILKDRKETLCTGYAFLIQAMSRLAGIESEIVNGFGRSDGLKKGPIGMANHSWNRVRLNGKWYLCDATWSAGYFDETNHLFVFEYDDSYFLMEPEKFAQSHYSYSNPDKLATER